MLASITIRFLIVDFRLVFNRQSKIGNRQLHSFSGDFVGRVTPVPIPNTEVKPAGADGTARETAWESRKSPGLIQKPARVSRAGFFPLLR